MATELRSLRISPEIDVGKYVAGAQEKVAADKAMAASNREVAATATDTSAKISQSGDVLARLSRQYVDGYASAQRFNSALNTLSRGIDSGKIKMSEASVILDGMYKKYQLAGDAAQFAAKGQVEFAAAVTAANAKLAAQRQILPANANRQNNNFAAFNAASQFQDIAIVSAMGQNPLTVGLQQGSQLGMALSMSLGEAGAAGAARTLGAALLGLLSPINLVAIGGTALVAWAVQYFTTVEDGSGKTAKDLEDQARLIDQVASKWGNALPALKAYNDALKDQKDIADAIAAAQAVASQQYDPVRSGLPELNIGQADIVSLLSMAGVDHSAITSFQKEYKELQQNIHDSTATAQDAIDVQRTLSADVLGVNLPAISDYAAQFGELASQIGSASDAANKFRGDAAGLEIVKSLPALNPLNGFNRTPFQTEEDIMFERSTRARQLAEDQAGPYGHGIPIPQFRGVDDVPVANDVFGKFQSSLTRQVDQLKTQREALGLTGKALDEYTFRQQALNQALAQNIELGPDQVAFINSQAQAYASQMQSNREYADARNTASGFVRTFGQELISSGGDIGKSLGKSIESALLDATSKAWERLADQIGIAFANWLTGGSGSGAGGSAFGTASGFADMLFGKGAANDNFAAPAGTVTRAPLANVGMSAYRDAIGSIESAGSGGYSALGPIHKTLGQALGRYQIMEANLPAWSQAALGRNVSRSEFLGSPALQDAIFDDRFGSYVNKYGASGAASMWFTGRPSAPNATDVLGTTGSAYVDKFNAALDKASAGLGGFDTGVTSAVKALSDIASNGFDLSSLMPGNFKANTTLSSYLGYTPQASSGGGILGSLFGWVGKLFGFADGTENAPPGWAWVGEQGPELRKLRGGDVIRSNQRSMQMVADHANQNRPSMQQKVELHVHVSGATGNEEVRRMALAGGRQAIAENEIAQQRGGFGVTQRRYNSNKN